MLSFVTSHYQRVVSAICYSFRTNLELLYQTLGQKETSAVGKGEPASTETTQMLFQIRFSWATPLLPAVYLTLNTSVVLTLVATSAIKHPVAVGLAPFSIWALHVIPAEGCVRCSGCILAGVSVVLGEQG